MQSRHPNPFPGLRPYRPDEDYLFFGRERETNDLLRRLRTTRFLAVIGRSGSGKSSLVRCGMIPRLHGGSMVGAGSSWRVAILRPREDPIGELARALSGPGMLGAEESGESPPSRRDIERRMTEVTLRSSSRGLADAVRQAALPAGDNVLVLVDQFEELFRYRRERQREDAANDAVAFVKLLLAAARQHELPIFVVLTMRSEFIGECTDYPGLPEAINHGQYLVPWMTRDQLRDAIRRPVEVAGAAIADRLVLRLLNEMGDRQDQLPVLQHALMRTWSHWETGGRRQAAPLDIPDYEAVGTMREALSRHADEAYRGLINAVRGRVFRQVLEQRVARSTGPLDTAAREAIERAVEHAMEREEGMWLAIGQVIRRVVSGTVDRVRGKRPDRSVRRQIAADVEQAVQAEPAILPRAERRLQRALIHAIEQALDRDLKRHDEVLALVRKIVRQDDVLRACREAAEGGGELDPVVRRALGRLSAKDVDEALERATAPPADGPAPDGEQDEAGARQRVLLGLVLNEIAEQEVLERDIERAIAREPGVRRATTGETRRAILDTIRSDEQASPAVRRAVRRVRGAVLFGAEQDAVLRVKHVMRKLFKTLTDTVHDPRGERRPRTVERAARICAVEPHEIVQVARRFREEGTNFLMPAAAADTADIVDISHESLIWIWDRLIEWAQEERESATLYLRVARAAAQHQLAQGALWRGLPLRRAVTWLERERPTAAWAEQYDPSFERAKRFLSLSEREERRRRLVLVWLPAAVVGTALFVVGLLLGCWWCTREARCGEDARRLAIQAQGRARPDRADEAARMALDAHRRNASCGGDPDQPQIYQALRVTLELLHERDGTQADPACLGGALLEVPDCEIQVGTGAGARPVESRAPVRAVAWARNGWLAVGGEDGHVYLLDPAAPSPRACDFEHLGSEVRALAWSAAGDRLAVGALDGTVRLLEPTTARDGGCPSADARELTRGAPGGPGPIVSALAFSAELLAAADSSGNLRLWSVGRESQQRVAPDVCGAVTAVALAPGDAVLATATRVACGEPAAFVQLWDVRASGSPPTRRGALALPAGAQGTLRTLAFSDDGRFLAAGSEEGDVVVWPAPLEARSEDPALLVAHQSAVTGLAFGDSRLAASSLDRTVSLWKFTDGWGAVPIVLEDHRSWVWSVAFRPGTAQFATGSDDRSVRAFSADTACLAEQLERLVR